MRILGSFCNTNVQNDHPYGDEGGWDVVSRLEMPAHLIACFHGLGDSEMMERKKD